MIDEELKMQNNRIANHITSSGTTAYGVLVALGVALSFVVGCPTGDPDSGSSDTEQQPPELPGVRIECCYELFGDGGTPVEIGCTYADINSPCIDPSDPELDSDGNGMLDAAERQDVCAMKCPDIIGPRDSPPDPSTSPAIRARASTSIRRSTAASRPVERSA